MKIVVGIFIVAIIALVIGCATPPNPFPTQSESIPAPPSKTEPLSYEVVRTYTEEVIVGTKPVGLGDGRTGSAVDLRNRACVEIKNTGNTGGLFSVYFTFSEENFGRDLIYLKSGETGVATYTSFQTFEDWKTEGLQKFKDKTAEWRYEITPVALKP